MDVIFMGTPDFAVPVLKALADSEKRRVTAVVTQPDKARGRSGSLSFTPVKKVALEYDIPVYTPTKVKDPEFVETLRGISCDVIVVVAFGQILSKEILEMPAYGCINWSGQRRVRWSLLLRRMRRAPMLKCSRKSLAGWTSPGRQKNWSGTSED